MFFNMKFYIFSVEDHDDLTPIFDEQNGTLINSYGKLCILLYLHQNNAGVFNMRICFIQSKNVYH